MAAPGWTFEEEAGACGEMQCRLVGTARLDKRPVTITLNFDASDPLIAFALTSPEGSSPLALRPPVEGPNVALAVAAFPPDKTTVCSLAKRWRRINPTDDGIGWNFDADESRRLRQGVDARIGIADIGGIDLPAGLIPFWADKITACEDDELTSFGIDPADYRERAVMPTRPALQLFDSETYPIVTLREGLEGTNRALVEFDRSGRVRDCRIVLPSGHEVLDIANCAVLTRRLRAPASTRDDRVYLAQTVRWQLAN